jgi:cyclopropane-fatty-acyl-phospholipid synthase
MIDLLSKAVDSGLMPEPVIRAGIRAICAKRLRQESGPVEAVQARHQRFVDELKASDIAIATEAANTQHYEVPASFYEKVLGPHLKYSSFYWPAGVDNLASAEAAMLTLYAERAELADGQRILDLGCGWGSFSLWAAAKYPTSQITALSNSTAQRGFIEQQASARGITNLKVITADLRSASLPGKFDRVVSIEMFEHMRNYQRLLKKIDDALDTRGKLFVHVFAHQHYAYPFADDDSSDWMAREFFTGGLMPSSQLLGSFQDDLRLDQQWHVNGVHYQKTAEAWYQNLMNAKAEVVALFEQAYGTGGGKVRFQRWRVFFLACAELFGYQGGQEWIVAHYLFAKR